MNFAIPCIKKFTKQNNLEEYLYIPYALAKYDNYTIQKTNRIDQLFKDTILPTFNKLNIKVAPKKGRLLVFYNTEKDSNKQHDLSMHGGNEVLKGEKWACNIWFRDKKYNS